MTTTVPAAASGSSARDGAARAERGGRGGQHGRVEQGALGVVAGEVAHRRPRRRQRDPARVGHSAAASATRAGRVARQRAAAPRSGQQREHRGGHEQRDVARPVEEAAGEEGEDDGPGHQGAARAEQAGRAHRVAGRLAPAGTAADLPDRARAARRSRAPDAADAAHAADAADAAGAARRCRCRRGWRRCLTVAARERPTPALPTVAGAERRRPALPTVAGAERAHAGAADGRRR